MNLSGALGKAKKFAAGHQKEVDQAIDKASGIIKKKTPDNIDKVVDSAAKKAKDEL